MKSARGSSSSSSALVEAIRRGSAPAGIVLLHVDPILIMGSLVGADLYGVQVPIVLLPADAWQTLGSARQVSVDATEDGATVHVD